MNNNYNSIFKKLIKNSINLLNEAVLSKDEILAKANQLKLTYNIPSDIFNELLSNNESNNYINLLKDIYNLTIVKSNIEKEKANKTKNIIRTKLEELLSFNFNEKDINSIDNELLKYKLDKKIYKIWLLILLKNKTPYLIEDLDMICSNLVIYDKYKDELNVELFDKNSLNLIIKNKQDLSQLVEKYKDIVYNNPLSNIYIDKGEAILLYEDSDIKVIIPKTHEASRYYGANSEWCTAYESPKNYNEYTSRGDLYIIIFKNDFINKNEVKINNKWEFHFEDNMFMDIDDAKLNEILLQDFFNKYFEVFVNRNKSYVITISKYLNKENIDKYKLINDEIINLFNQAIEKNAYIIEYLQYFKDMLSNEEIVNLFNQAIEKDPNLVYYLQYFKDILSSNYIISKFNQVIEKEPDVIEYLKNFKDIFSSDYIISKFNQAIEKEPHVVYYLQYFKDKLSSEGILSLFNQAIEKDPYVIKYLQYFKDILSSNYIISKFNQAIEKKPNVVYYLSYFKDKLTHEEIISLEQLANNLNENKINKNKSLESYIRNKVKKLLNTI